MREEYKYNKYSELPELYQQMVQEFIDTSLEIAKPMLASDKGFLPFAQYVGVDNQLGIIGIDNKLSENTCKAIEGLKEHLNNGIAKMKYIAVSLTFDSFVYTSRKESKQSAICINIKIPEYFLMKYFYPYAINQNNINYLDPIAARADVLM